MSDNYIAVLYYAFHEKYANDNVAFYDFLVDNVHTAEDIEALCFDCDLNDTQFRMVQMNFILPKSVLSKCRDKLDWAMTGDVEHRMFDGEFVGELRNYVSW